MKEYIVSIPIAGYKHVGVVANSPEEAERLAWDNPEEGELEYEYFEQLCKGNVLYASRYNEVNVYEVGDADE